MSDKVAATARITEERRDKWDEWVDTHPTIISRATLIRRGVSKYMDEDPLHPKNDNKKKKEINKKIDKLNNSMKNSLEQLEEIQEKQLTKSEMDELAEKVAEKIIEKRMRA